MNILALFIQFIHVLFGVSFLGIAVASFIYISKSIQQKNAALLRYAIKTSLLGDCILFPIIILQIASGTFLVQHNHLSFNTPWIIVAYIVFAVVSLIWLLLVLIKYSNFSAEVTFSFRYKKSFIILNVLMIILFFMIIHDAVTQQTFLWRQ